MTKFARHLWMPVVIVLIAGIGALTVTRLQSVFGSHNDVLNPETETSSTVISFNTKQVRYEVFGPPGSAARISYLDLDAQPREVIDAPLPWSLAIVTTMSSVVANIVAQGETIQLGCRITVNGVIRDERVVDAQNAQTTCLVKSA